MADREQRGDDSADSILQFFAYDHLPVELHETALMFHAAANWLARHLKRNPMRTVCLTKLLEAKDAALRSATYRDL